jgi:hypothetical protein
MTAAPTTGIAFVPMLQNPTDQFRPKDQGHVHAHVVRAGRDIFRVAPVPAQYVG